jgi:hypothetical protein
VRGARGAGGAWLDDPTAVVRSESEGAQKSGSFSGSTTEKCVTSEEHAFRTSSYPGHIMSVFASVTAAIECSAVRCDEHCHRWWRVCAHGVRKEKLPPWPRTPKVTWGTGGRSPMTSLHSASKAGSTPQQVM